MEKKPYPSDIQDRFIVRFPEGMRQHIADLAAANGRSMNSEIIFRLQRTLQWDEVEHPHPNEIEAQIRVTAERLERLVKEYKMLTAFGGQSTDAAS